MSNHLTHDDLVLHYYGETPREEALRVARHLDECDGCRAEAATLGEVLRMVVAAPPADPRPGFERDVWARIEPRLDKPASRWRAWFAAPRWVLAGGAAALVAAAFVAGRFTGAPVPPAPSGAPAVAVVEPSRVFTAEVRDHLERSQMVLVELANASGEDAGPMLSGQHRAADLVAASRVYRQSAASAGDGPTVDLLEDIERVLLEVANASSDASSKELADVKARIEARDLVFRVRVTASELRRRLEPDREPGDRGRLRAPVS